MSLDYTLSAGGYVIICDNPTAFAYRNPSAPAVGGSWSGKLKGGQILYLTYWGNVLQQFVVQDFWPGSNEHGFSYVVNDPASAPTNISDVGLWGLSTKGISI